MSDHNIIGDNELEWYIMRQKIVNIFVDFKYLVLAFMIMSTFTKITMTKQKRCFNSNPEHRGW